MTDGSNVASGWVKDEVNTGFEEERKRGQIVLFPLRLDDAVMDTKEAWAAKLRARLIGDFRRWKDLARQGVGMDVATAGAFQRLD